MIDLHCHSTFSDGDKTPEELVAMAREIGLAALALTDHDTMAGLPRFFAADGGGGADVARGFFEAGDIVLVGGCELSVEFGGRDAHMLCYGADPVNGPLAAKLEEIRSERDRRNRKILARLNELGIGISWEDVVKHARDGVVGRPHFAAAMIEAGYAKDKYEVFDEWLGEGKKAHVEREHVSAAEAISLIHGAGGVAVLAHPHVLRLSRKNMATAADRLAADGLDGLECHYSEHSAAQTRFYRSLAEARGMLVTGGSDYHGKNMPGVGLGRGFGGLRVPEELLAPLLNIRCISNFDHILQGRISHDINKSFCHKPLTPSLRSPH